MLYNIREGEEVFCKIKDQIVVASIDWINIGKAQADVVPFGNYKFGIHTVSLDVIILSDVYAREWYFTRYLPSLSLYTRRKLLCSMGS